MGIIRRKLIFALVVVFLCCSVCMQACQESSTQFPVELNYYKDDDTSEDSKPLQMLLDSDLNQYLFYQSSNGSNTNVHLTKIDPNGTDLWTKEYPGLIPITYSQLMQLSKDGSSIKLIVKNSSNYGQLTEISTADGNLNTAVQFTNIFISTGDFSTPLKCSPNTDTQCFFICVGTSSADLRVCKADYSSPSSINYADPDDASLTLNTIDAVDDDQFIVGGFDISSTPHKHIFYSSNISMTGMNWAVQTDTLENYFYSASTRRMHSFLNNNLTKYVATAQYSSDTVVFVLHPSNGSVVEIKLISYSQSGTAPWLNANGRVADDKIIHSFTVGSPNRLLLSIINIETWEINSYYFSSITYTNFFTPIFNSDQIFLVLEDYPASEFYVFRAAYDKLNYTELFTEMTASYEDVSSNFTFSSLTLTQTLGSDSTSDLSITPVASNFSVDTDRTYRATANLHSLSVETYNSTINTSAIIGPIAYDCYDVTMNGTSATLSNVVTMSEGEGGSIPNWMAFNPSTASILVVHSTETSSNNFTISNTISGVFGSFVLNTNFTINITEPTATQNDGDDKDYCLNTSSKALCGVYLGLIGLAVL